MKNTCIKKLTKDTSTKLSKESFEKIKTNDNLYLKIQFLYLKKETAYK